MRPELAPAPASHPQRVPVVVIGAGQAGLALGYHLARWRLPFVILDGAPALGHSWRRRWDSLTLFTPAWHSHLPGLPLPLPPDAYPTKDDIADYLERYAAVFALPIRLNAPVSLARATATGYRVHAGATVYDAEQIALATGPYQRQAIPSFASHLDPEVVQIASSDYRHPGQVPPGDVLAPRMELNAAHDGRVVALVVRDLALAFARQSAAPSVAYVLGGPAGGAWRLGAAASPAATIWMDALDFNLLVSGRLTPGAARRLPATATRGEPAAIAWALEHTSVVY